MVKNKDTYKKVAAEDMRLPCACGGLRQGSCPPPFCTHPKPKTDPELLTNGGPDAGRRFSGFGSMYCSTLEGYWIGGPDCGVSRWKTHQAQVSGLVTCPCSCAVPIEACTLNKWPQAYQRIGFISEAASSPGLCSGRKACEILQLRIRHPRLHIIIIITIITTTTTIILLWLSSSP